MQWKLHIAYIVKYLYIIIVIADISYIMCVQITFVKIYFIIIVIFRLAVLHWVVLRDQRVLETDLKGPLPASLHMFVSWLRLIKPAMGC